MNYNVDFFIKKFSAIPENKWCTGVYERDGKHCADGHCGTFQRSDGLIIQASESLALVSLIKKYLLPDAGSFTAIMAINDGWRVMEYPQPTPKQRILAALNDIKKMQDGQAPEIQPPVKVITKYVSMPESIIKNNQIVLS